MALTPIDDDYINSIIKSAGPYNPALNKTQGVKLRELIKLLRDQIQQGGGGTTDATTTSKGIVQLAGDLSGAADSPTVPQLSSKADLNNNNTFNGIFNVFKNYLSASSINISNGNNEYTILDSGQLSNGSLAGQITFWRDNAVDPNSTSRYSTTINQNVKSDIFGVDLTLPAVSGTLALLSDISTGGTTDATTTSKGIVQLAGDLSGTADSPTVPQLSSKADLNNNNTFNGIFNVFKNYLSASSINISNGNNEYTILDSGQLSNGSLAGQITLWRDNAVDPNSTSRYSTTISQNVKSDIFGVDLTLPAVSGTLALLSDIPTGSSGSAELQSVTYAQLMGLINGNLLVPAKRYLITDFASRFSKYTLVIDQNTGSSTFVIDYSVGNRYSGPNEPIVVIAKTTNTILDRAYSTIYPNHVLNYTLNNITTGVTASDKGTILRRIDLVRNVNINFDFMAMKCFIDPGSGLTDRLAILIENCVNSYGNFAGYYGATNACYIAGSFSNSRFESDYFVDGIAMSSMNDTVMVFGWGTVIITPFLDFDHCKIVSPINLRNTNGSISYLSINIGNNNSLTDASSGQFLNSVVEYPQSIANLEKSIYSTKNGVVYLRSIGDDGNYIVTPFVH